MKRTSVTAMCALGLALIAPQHADAVGGPIAPVEGTSIGVHGSPYRYATFSTAGTTTVVERTVTASGRAVTALPLPGRYGIPAIDYTGGTTGLSADGRTLVLAELPGGGPVRSTRLLVIDTAPLAVRIRLTVPGWSTVDAISPDGRWLYLIHYPAADISRYEVRAFDLASHRLLRRPVVDPRERGEAMTGIPVTRATSGDGRWAYTLYQRPSGVPFIHALDTVGRRAVCVDLPSLSGVDLGEARLALGPAGARLGIYTGGVTRALIDTRTFAVGNPSATAADPVTRGRDGVPWEAIVLSAAALCAVAGVWLRSARR